MLVHGRSRYVARIQRPGKHVHCLGPQSFATTEGRAMLAFDIGDVAHGITGGKVEHAVVGQHATGFTPESVVIRFDLVVLVGKWMHGLAHAAHLLAAVDSRYL